MADSREAVFTPLWLRAGVFAHRENPRSLGAVGDRMNAVWLAPVVAVILRWLVSRRPVEVDRMHGLRLTVVVCVFLLGAVAARSTDSVGGSPGAPAAAAEVDWTRAQP